MPGQLSPGIVGDSDEARHEIAVWSSWQEELGGLIQIIKTAVAQLPVLGIPEDEVFVFFPPDLVREGLGEELIAEITGLFDKPERTSEVLKTLTDAIADQLQIFASTHLPQCGSTEAFIVSMLDPKALSYRRLPTSRRLVGPPFRQ